MPGPITVSKVAEAATKVRPMAHDLGQMLPFEVESAAHNPYVSQVDELAQATFDLPKSDRPKLVIVGIGRTPPLTTQSLIEQATKRGMVPGDDVIATRYADLRVGKQRGFVRMAAGTGADGMVLAGQGQRALFLFRGGGNLKDVHFDKIAKIQSVEGATALTDLDAIRRLGSKSITNDVLLRAGVALPETEAVHGAGSAIAAFDRITTRFGADTAVLKKVNSLGGKDVHFVRTHDDIRRVINAEPDADYVMQEYLAAAKDQDIRVHGTWNAARGDYDLPNSYVRNRNATQLTPNLANGGFPTNYILSPWEEDQVRRSMLALAGGSSRPPLHIGLDLFPRRSITASVVEDNMRLQQAASVGSVERAMAMAESRDTAVVGEAASSAGTKGTEIVLGAGENPVTANMLREITRMRGDQDIFGGARDARHAIPTRWD
jgi:hypothetical protein